MNSPENPASTALTALLRQRAQKHRRQSDRLLLFVFLIVSIGFAVFYFADYIVDLQQNETEIRLLVETHDLNRILDERLRNLSESARAFIPYQPAFVKDMDLRLKQAEQAFAKALTDAKIEAGGKADIGFSPTFDAQARAIARGFDDMSSRLGEMIQKMTEPVNKCEEAVTDVKSQFLVTRNNIDNLKESFTAAKGDTKAIVSKVSIRVGAVVMLIFLVQIFVSVFRYQYRLATHFDARADALEFAAMHGPINLESLVHFFSSEKIDFSKETSPIEHAVELAEKLSKLKERD